MLQSTMNQSAPVGLVLGAGLDDQHMLTIQGRAYSSQCIKARLGVAGDDDNAGYFAEDSAHGFVVKGGWTFGFLKVVAEKDYGWFVEGE